VPADISFTIDSAELEAAFNKSPIIVATRLQTWVVTSALKTERESKQQLRRMVSSATSGQTLSSINTKTGFLQAEIRAHTDYAKYTITGRGPGKMPPFGDGSDLANWARRAGINPFLVARAIGRKGTKGIPYMEDAYQNIKNEINRDGDTAVEQIIKDLV